MNFNKGFGGQPFGSVPCNSSSPIPPLLQPLLDASSAGNISASQLEAIRNAAMSTENASSAASNSTQSNTFLNSLTPNPFGLPLPPLPQMSTASANQAQITSDLLYTQSASSLFFPLPAFHQQSRLTLSSSSSSSSSFANTPSALNSTSTATHLMPPGAAAAAAAAAGLSTSNSLQTFNFLAQNASPLELSAALANLNANTKAMDSTTNETQTDTKPCTSNATPDPCAMLAALAARFPSAEFLAANFPSLWYSSLAARGLAVLSNQIYFNNMLKSAANGAPLPMPPLFPDLNQQPPFFPLPNPFESFLASNNANLPSLNGSMQNPQTDSDTKPFSMQAIPLLSPNNSRYQQPLPELKISPCDSTKADSDRKKFSPDSSTALHSPQQVSALSNGQEDQSPTLHNKSTLNSSIPIRPNPTSPYLFLSQHDPVQTGPVIRSPINSIANHSNPPIAHSHKPSSKASSRAIACNQTLATCDEPTLFKPINENLIVTDYSCKTKPIASSPSKPNNTKRKQTSSTSHKKHRETITFDDLTPALNQLVLPSNHISDAGLPLPPLVTSELSSLPITTRTFGNLHQSSSSMLSNSSSSSSPLIASVDLLAASSNDNASINPVPINYNTQSPVVSSTKQHSSDLNSSSPELIGSPLFLSQSSHSLSPCAPRLPSPGSPSNLSTANPLSPVDATASSQIEINSSATLSTNSNIPINPTRTRCVPPKKTIQSASTCASYNPMYWGSPSSDQIPSPHEISKDELGVKSLTIDTQPEKQLKPEVTALSNEKCNKHSFGQLELDLVPTLQEPNCDAQSAEVKLNEEPEVKDDQQQRIPKLSIKLDKCKNKERKNKRSKRSRDDSQSSNSVMSDLLSNDLIRRHSTDEMLLTSKDTQTASGESDFVTLPRVRCETYSGPESLDKSRNKRTSKKRDSSINLDPWTIRRSERIFLHSAYQSHSNPNESSGSLNLILTSNRKLQKDAADAAAAENLNTCNQAEEFSSEQTNNSNQVSTGMFSGSVALLGNYGHVSPEDCQLLQLIEWTREDRLPKTSEFKLQRKQLHQQRQRILLRSDELLYAGQTRCRSESEDEPKTSVLLRLDGETNDRHMTLQQLLNQAIREYKPIKIDQLHEGTRVCAYWSNRARCLYPGRISKLLANDLVQVEFDDGDKARIALTDIRLLPDSFICDSEYDELEENVQDMPMDSLAASACSERVGESGIRIRLNSSSDRHKRRKHHHTHKHHHLKRRKHKKRNKNLLESSHSESIEVEEDDLKKKKTTNESMLDDENESLDESSDSDSNCESDTENLDDSKVSVASEDKSTNGNQWICEMNDERVSRRNQSSSCKAVIRRKQSNKKATSSGDSKRSQNGSSKIAAFLLDRQLWHWHGEPNRSMRGRYRSKKLFYDAIIRDDEIIRVNDCAVFLSTGRPSLPFVGRIDSMWQNPNGTMLVRVRWFYHPEETKTQPELLDSKGALFESDHFDNNEVQTISHKCLVLPYHEYIERKRLARLNGEEDEDDPPNIYYFSGLYESLSGRISIDEAVPFK